MVGNTLSPIIPMAGNTVRSRRRVFIRPLVDFFTLYTTSRGCLVSHAHSYPWFQQLFFLALSHYPAVSSCCSVTAAIHSIGWHPTGFAHRAIYSTVVALYYPQSFFYPLSVADVNILGHVVISVHLLNCHVAPRPHSYSFCFHHWLYHLLLLYFGVYGKSFPAGSSLCFYFILLPCPPYLVTVGFSM